jgi:hypothetical protein
LGVRALPVGGDPLGRQEADPFCNGGGPIGLASMRLSSKLFQPRFGGRIHADRLAMNLSE